MTLQTLGDMAINTLLRNRSFESKNQVTRLTQELSTGITQNKAEAVRYDFAALAGIERSISMNTSFKSSASEAGLFVTGAQSAMGVVTAQMQDSSSAVMLAVNAGTQTTVDATRSEVESRFRAMVGTLNQTVAGRSVFAGRTTDAPALADPQVILDTLEPLALAATSAADWQAALDTWFGPGGDFETLGYLGDTTPLTPFVLGDTQRAQMDITADDPAIRDALKAMASVALLDKTGFSGDLAEQRVQLQTALDGALSAQGRLTSLRADIGIAEETIEGAKTMLANEKTALELARNDLLAVDPYETATRFEEANRQLESLYMITARISRLSLSDFI